MYMQYIGAWMPVPPACHLGVVPNDPCKIFLAVEGIVVFSFGAQGRTREGPRKMRHCIGSPKVFASSSGTQRLSKIEAWPDQHVQQWKSKHTM